MAIKKSNRLVGQKFGKLTVLQDSLERSHGSVLWKCQCDCGKIVKVIGYDLTRGHTKTCGCSRRLDLTGKRFGRLIALQVSSERASDNSILWKCQCDCGNIKNIRARSLINGDAKSCGCLRQETFQKRIHDLTNQKFGKLTVIEKAGVSKNGNIQWKCLCECGNIKIVAGGHLLEGSTQSCGCIQYSIGEKNIEKILLQHNIPFKKEYIIKELNNKRFDFAILNSANQIIRLIEFDGRQHYEEVSCFSQSLKQVQESDKIKNQWAKQHNIPLVRIPYWKRDNITLDLIMEDKYLI